MPAYFIDGDGVRVYPNSHQNSPPPPPQTGTNAPGLNSALSTALQATNAYNKGTGDKTTAEKDWGVVENIIENQYREALSSSDPKAAVAALDKQYAGYFQDHGFNSTIYNQVVSDASGAAGKETPGMRAAQLQLFNAENEPAGTATQALDFVTADLNVELETEFGDGNGGVYTTDQINSAAAAATKQLGASATPFVNYVAATMSGGSQGQGQTLSDVLDVLQTPGLALTPAELKSGYVGGIKLTPAEIQAKALILTPGEAQLAGIDPVTLAFLMADGVTVGPLSPQMVQLAQQNPALFSYMEINGVNITVVKAGAPAAPGDLQFNLGKGQVLEVTLNGQPITAQQLPPGWLSSVDATNLVSLYAGAEATKKGSGVVAVASTLLPQLQLNPKSLSSATSTLPTDSGSLQQVSLASLMQSADNARTGYLNGQLTTLLDAAPDSASKGAPGYISGTVNPLLTTQLNGFFSDQAQQSFWNYDPSITELQNYLDTGLSSQFNSGNKNALGMGANYFSQVLSGATPDEAKMLIGLVENQVNGLNLNTDNPYNHAGESHLLMVLSQAVQIADQMVEADPSAAPGPVATQVATWINSPQGIQLLNGAANSMFNATGYFGNSDLANALVDSIYTIGGGVNLNKYNVSLGANLSDYVQDGEQYYTKAEQKLLGSTDYAAFKANQQETLSDFRAQFANAPNIGTQVSASNIPALTNGITTALGFNPNKLTLQQTNIVNLDLAWIKNQAGSGATVTILPFLFASSTLGVQNGVFFDISNQDPNDPHKHTQVLIDGSAASAALAQDPNVLQDPTHSDVTWHYSSYRDFQLSNQMYQDGTIYTLTNNPLGIGADGEASSATDFHKEFDGVMNFVANEGVMAAGIVLAPVTDGGSLVVAGLISLGWNTYVAKEQYDQIVSHGEYFGWSNPNTRWDIVGDGMLAANYLTLGTGVAAGGFNALADGFGAAANLETSVASFQGAMGMSEVFSTSGYSDALITLKNLNSGIATGFTWVSKGTEVAAYGLGAVQTGYSTYSTAANWDSMSWTQRLEGLGNIGMGFLPAFMHPLTEAAGALWGRNADSGNSTDYEAPPETADFAPTEGNGSQDLFAQSATFSVGGDSENGPTEGLSPDVAQALTDQFNTHLQNVTDSLEGTDPSASIEQRWQDVIFAASEFDAAEGLDATLGDQEPTRTAALAAAKSKLDAVLDGLVHRVSNSPDCDQPNCGGHYEADGYCDECGMSNKKTIGRADLLPEIRAAISNTDAQNVLCADVYDGLIQAPGGAYVQDSLSADEFANSCLFLPDTVFELVARSQNGSPHAFVPDSNNLIVFRANIAATDFADYMRDPTQPEQQVVTVSTTKSLLAHEAGHLVTNLRNPGFKVWSRGVQDATGFNPEEALSEIYSWENFGEQPGAVSGSPFPYAHSNDQAFADAGPGKLLMVSIYSPETVAAEYLYQRAGQAVYRDQTGGDEAALAQVTPEEFRDAGQNLVYAARYGNDPAAMAIVGPLVEGPVAKFYNKYKANSAQAAAAATDSSTDLNAVSVTNTVPGEDPNTPATAYPGASPQAQTAFDTLLGSSGGLWTPDSWKAINDYIDAALHSPDPDLRAAAVNARAVLGDPSGAPAGIILSADDADALGTLISADIAATQRAKSGVVVASAPANVPVTLAAPAVFNQPVRQGDAATVTDQLLQANGATTDAGGPLFGSKKSDGKQWTLTQSALGEAGYDEDVQSQVAAYLNTLPRAGGLGALHDLTALSFDEHQQIQILTGEVIGDGSGISNPAEFAAKFLVDVSGLPPESREQLFENGQTLLAPPQQWQSFSDFINSGASGDDAALNAHQATFLLSLPSATDRGAAIDSMTALIQAQDEAAAAPVSGQDPANLNAGTNPQVSTLVDIAAANNVPTQLVQSFGTPTVVPLDAAINVMPVVDGVSDLPSSSSAAYDDAGKAIAGKITPLLEAYAGRKSFVGDLNKILKDNKAGKSLTGQINALLDRGYVGDTLATKINALLKWNRADATLTGQVNDLLAANPQGNAAPGTLRILLDTGVLDDETAGGLRKPSVSGPVAAALTTASLQKIAALGAKSGVTIEVTVATNHWTKPVLIAANDAVGVKGVKVVDPLGPDARQAVFNGLNPDVYICVGQSDSGVQTSSFLDLAVNCPSTTTFALSDGTDIGGAQALGVVDYPMTASTVEIGAQVLVSRVLSELGSDNVPLWADPVSKGPMWQAQVRPTQVDKAYQAVAKSGTLNDGRFPGLGSGDPAPSIKSFVGASVVVQRAIDATRVLPASEPDTWREQFVQGYSQLTAGSGITFADHTTWLSQAAPGNAFDKSIIATQGLFQRANTANRNSLLTLGGLAGASTLGIVGMTAGWVPAGLHGDYEVILATLGTVPRQLDIIDKTLLGQWDWYARKRGISIAGDQNTSQVNLQRRTFWSDVLRTVTYPVTGAADIYTLATTHAVNFAGYAAHGAEIVLIPIVGWLEYVYLRKLGNTSIDAEGKFTTDLNSNLKGWEVKANQYGAYGGFSTASAGLLLASGDPTFTLNYILIAGRSAGNFGQTYSAWKEQLTGKKPDKLDTGSTVVGSGSIIVTQVIQSLPGVIELYNTAEMKGEKMLDTSVDYTKREVPKLWRDLENDL